MKVGALLIAGVAAYESEWVELQEVQGQRNGDLPEAFKATVDLEKAHNSLESTDKLAYTTRAQSNRPCYSARTDSRCRCCRVCQEEEGGGDGDGDEDQLGGGVQWISQKPCVKNTLTVDFH